MARSEIGADQARDLAIPLISFANANGGVLAIGLHDGKCKGLGDDRRTLNG